MNSQTVPLSTSSDFTIATAAVRRAAIYCRISLDKSGESAGVSRQREDGIALCLARGMSLRTDVGNDGVYTDNDISASHGAHRPAYEELMAAADRREFDVIIVWQLSRLWRNRRERAEGLERLSAARISIVAVKGTDLDLSNASGRMIAGVLGEFDTMESEIKSERMIRQAQQAAEQGKRRMGGNRPFGYAADRVSILENEAAVIRDAATRVLAGESLRSICAELNREGTYTATGKPWTTQGLRQVLGSARISGRREYQPKDSFKGRARPLTGTIVATAEWSPIISADQSDRLRAFLTNPARRRTPAEARKTILSGILRCGKCNAAMVSRPRQGQPRYCCISDPGRGGCGRTVIDGKSTDDRVRDLVVALLADSPAFVERLHRPVDAGSDLVGQLRADEERLEELAADYAAGEITRGEWKSARAVLVARVESARARMARSTNTTALAGFIGPREEMLITWSDSMNNSQRRAVVQAVIDHIEVRPKVAAGRFDPERIQPVWRS